MGYSDELMMIIISIIIIIIIIVMMMMMMIMIMITIIIIIIIITIIIIFTLRGSAPRSNPLLFIYHFSRKSYPFRIPSIEKW